MKEKRVKERRKEGQKRVRGVQVRGEKERERERDTFKSVSHH
jgi:hypothetical protein